MLSIGRWVIPRPGSFETGRVLTIASVGDRGEYSRPHRYRVEHAGERGVGGKIGVTTEDLIGTHGADPCLVISSRHRGDRVARGHRELHREGARRRPRRR